MRYTIIAGIRPNPTPSDAAPGKYVAYVGARGGPKWAHGYQRTGNTKRLACDALSAALSGQFPKHTFRVEPDTLD